MFCFVVLLILGFTLFRFVMVVYFDTLFSTGVCGGNCFVVLYLLVLFIVWRDFEFSGLFVCLLHGLVFLFGFVGRVC